jgi:enoyl-[acyl-carrier protein] reductase I
MGFLTGKRALIVGILNNRSIAYGIAQSMHREGAELAFTYVNDKLKSRVEAVAKEFGSDILIPCDVTNDQQIKDVFSTLKKYWDGLDILVHSVAYAPADQLEGEYIDSVSREGFKIAHDISSYSFVALAQAAYPMMEGRKGSMVTMTYQGSTRVVPNYNTMGVAKASLEANMRYMASSLGPKGIRVNAISAGPIKTLASSGVKSFKKMLSYHEKVAPLRENITQEQVGDATAFICSDLAGGITGEIIHVDSGFHSVAMGALED